MLALIIWLRMWLLHACRHFNVLNKEFLNISVLSRKGIGTIIDVWKCSAAAELDRHLKRISLTCPQIAEPFKLNQCSPSSLQRWQCEWNPVWEELRNGNDGDLRVFLKEWHHGTISIQISKDIHLHSTPLWDQRYPYHQVQLQKLKSVGSGPGSVYSLFQVRLFQLASMGHGFHDTLEKDASTGSSI